jgi:hypothetical protein
MQVHLCPGQFVVFIAVLCFELNRQLSPQTITQSSVSSLNYENDRSSPQTFATGSISSPNYENGHFGPQTTHSSQIHPWPIAKYPFYPSIPTHRSLLANRSCRSSSPEMEQGPHASFAERTHAPFMACLHRGRA